MIAGVTVQVKGTENLGAWCF